MASKKKKGGKRGSPAPPAVELSSTGPFDRLPIRAGACLGGMLAVYFAWPRWDVWPLAFVGFAPLLALLGFRESKRAALTAWLSGLAYFLLVLAWIATVRFPAPVGCALVALLFSLFFPVWTACMRRAKAVLPGWLFVLFPAAFWVFFEWLFSHGKMSFPWYALGYSQAGAPWLMGIPSAAGVWGVSFVAMLVNTLIALWAESRRPPSPGEWGAAAAVVLMLVAGGAVVRPTLSEETVRVALVQGNFPQDVKDDANHNAEVFGRHVDMTRKAAAEEAGKLDLAIWSETVVPSFYAEPSRPVLEDIVKQTGAEIFLGVDEYIYVDGPREEWSSYRNFNGSWLIASDPARSDAYRKMQVVPGGEFMPWRSVFNALGLKDWVNKTVYSLDTSPGDRATVFELKEGAKFGAMICFESVYGRLARRLVEGGANFLVVATNDAWFGHSDGAYQHVAIGRMRAMETGRYIAQSANTGISFIAGPDGALRAKSKLDDTTSLVGDVRPASGDTLYTRLGDWLPVACMLYSFACIAFSLRKPKKTPAE